MAAAAAVAAAVAIVWLRYGLNPRAFFIDDSQAQIYPAFHEIARLLRSGEAPWVTLRSWFGGNFAGESVYGVFHPVLMGLVALLGGLRDLPLLATTMVSVHVAIAALGAFRLARHFGTTAGYAAVAAFAIASNGFLLYWYAAAWLAGLVGFAWFLWASLFLLRVAEQPRLMLPAALFLALLWVAGYPASLVALGLFVSACLAPATWLVRSWAALPRLAVAGVAGTLVARPALVPVTALYAVSLRADASGFGLSTFLSGSFAGLLSAPFPSFLPVMQTWGPNFSGKYGIVEMPFYYVGWFLVPAAVFVDWRQVWREKPPAIIGLACASLAFLVLCRIPSLNLFRWSFKYIPYYATTLVLLATALLSRPELLRLDGRRALAGLGLIWVLAAVAMASSPGEWRAHLFSAAALAAALAAFRRLATVRGGAAVAVFTFCVAVAVVAASGARWRSNTELPDPGLGALGPQARFLGTEGEGHTVLNAGGPTCCDPEDRSEFAFGNGGFLSRNRFINGYSTMQPAALHRELCVNHAWGLYCDDVFDRLFARDPTTGVAVADLMGIDIVAVPRGPKLERFLAAASGDWRVVRETGRGVAYARDLHSPAAGSTLSWASPGVTAAIVGRDGLDERLQLELGPGGVERLLVFSRAWYPGYRARLDGAEIDVVPHRGFIVAVRLPAASRGAAELELDYRLPGLPWSAALTVVGLLAAALVSARAARRSS